jgi:FxsC-like protein
MMLISEVAPARRDGRIVTFYSYKGGTGRSMAMANVAWILASQGLRVLVIDWDLEAPGLHRYFHPYLADPELASSQGIIDFLTAFVEGAHQASPDGCSPGWFEAYTDLEPYMFSLDWDFPGEGTLDVVPAGQQGPSYAARVTGFNWQGFYERLGGGVFLEAVKRNLRCEYDWILVDSRTGISDTSGICTVQLPDDLVVCYTLNDQSMTGAAAVAQSVVAQRTRPDGTPGLRVFPVRTRVERAETARLHAAKEMAERTFAPFLTHVPREKQNEYWGSAEVLYHPFYAYEEVLAPFGDPPQQSGSMLSAMESITAHLTDRAVTRLAEFPEKRRLQERDRFLRQPPASTGPLEKTDPVQVEVRGPGRDFPSLEEPERIVPRSEAWSYLAYLSYARVDADSYFERFLIDFTETLRQFTAGDPWELLFVDRDLVAGSEWPAEVRHAVATSRTCVPLYSPAYFRAEQCGREFQAFLERGRHHDGTGILPLLWGPSSKRMPRAAAQIQYVYPHLPEEYAERGLRSLLLRGGRRGRYMQVLEDLARIVVDTAKHAPLPLAALPRLSELPNAFGDVGAPTGRDSSVQVVYVVGDRDTMRAIRREEEVYGESPLDWRPLGSSPLHALVEQTAGSEKLFPDVVPFDPDFVDRVLHAEQMATPVAICVDPWALEIPSYEKLLRRLGDRLPGNVAVFVVWDSSHDTHEYRELLQTRLQTSLVMLEGSRTRRYHARIESEAAFTRSFASTMVAMTAELQGARNVFSGAASSTLSQAG